MCEDRGGTGREAEGTEQAPGDSYRHDRPASAFLTESRPKDSGGQYTLATPDGIAIPKNFQKLARCYIPARGDEPAFPKALVHASPPTSAVPIAGRHRRKCAAARGITVVMMRLGGRLLPALRHQHDWNRGRPRFSCRHALCWPWGSRLYRCVTGLDRIDHQRARPCTPAVLWVGI
jgi:hypothetical protein